MPVALRDWAEPMMAEARQNLQAAYLLWPAPETAATFCMLLQMVFEKITKAAYARSGADYPRNHQVTAYLFGVLDRMPNPALALKVDRSVRQFVAELETANPQIAGRGYPNLEYPWEDATVGVVCCPPRDHHLVKRAIDPRDLIAQRCLRSASALVNGLFSHLP